VKSKGAAGFREIEGGDDRDRVLAVDPVRRLQADTVRGERKDRRRYGQGRERVMLVRKITNVVQENRIAGSGESEAGSG